MGQTLTSRYSIEAVSPTLRVAIFQERVLSLLDSGKFIQTDTNELDTIAKLFNQYSKKTCPVAFRAIGYCYLVFQQPAKSKHAFMRSQAATEDRHAYADTCFGLTLSILAETGAKVDAAAHLLKELSNARPIPAQLIYNQYIQNKDLQLVSQLRITYGESFANGYIGMMEYLKKTFNLKDEIISPVQKGEKISPPVKSQSHEPGLGDGFERPPPVIRARVPSGC